MSFFLIPIVFFFDPVPQKNPVRKRNEHIIEATQWANRALERSMKVYTLAIKEKQATIHGMDGTVVTTVYRQAVEAREHWEPVYVTPWNGKPKICPGKMRKNQRLLAKH